MNLRNFKILTTLALLDINNEFSIECIYFFKKEEEFNEARVYKVGCRISSP